MLTKEEIAAAEAIIVAADKNVEMARFDGKPVIMVPVADGIHKAEVLINQAVSGTVPIYHYSGDASGAASEGENDSVGRQIYKHLMNGVSHMLPFVIGGGILIALAFLLDDYSIDPSNFGKNTPLAAYLKTIGEQAFGMMLPILAGFIAMSIADRPGLAVGLVAGLIAKMGSTFANPAGGDVNAGFLGALFAGFAGGYIVLGLKKLFSKLPKSLEGIKPVLLYPVIGIFLAAVVTTFINPYMGMINDGLTHFLNGMGGTSRVVLGMILGGMMSIDMGGPFNKAAYVFGTAQLAEGNFEVMAAVMAGGMVPPIAIALCTTFFKKKFTEKERQSGVVNYVMGSFLHYRRRYSICSAGSSSCNPVLSHRFCHCRWSVHGIWLYVKSTSRRIIRTAYHRQSGDVSGSSCDRSCCRLLNPGNSEKERGRIKYCIFLYIAGESRYILKGVFYSSPAKGRNGRAVFAPGHILLYEKAMKINGKIIFKKC